MSLWRYITKFFNTNYFTLLFAIALLALSIIKYLKIPQIQKKWFLFAIISLGVALRVAWLFYSSHVPRFAWGPAMLENDVINVHAVDLTRGVWFMDEHGVPSLRRPIGYPLFLGFLYKLFGVHLWVTQVSSLALFTVSAVLIHRITRLLFSEGAALLAVFLFCIYPVSIYSVAMITDEHLFLPLWYAGLFLLLKELRGHRVPAVLFWYGLLFGYATMTRTHTIFMPFVVALAYFLMKRSWRAVGGAFVVVLLVMQLINLPWVIRNYKLWGVPVLYTATGENVYNDLNSYATPEGAGHIPRKGEAGYSAELAQAQKEGKSALAHGLANREMTRWMLTHPKEFSILGVKRCLVFMGWNRTGVWPIWYQFYEGAYDPARPVSPAVRHFFEEAAYAFYYGVLFSFLFAIVFLIRRRKDLEAPVRRMLTVLMSVFIFWGLEHMVIFPDRKYRFPLEPLMIVIASPFLWKILSGWKWEDLRWNRRFGFARRTS